MMLKRKSSQSKSGAWSLLRAGVAGLGVVLAGSAVTAGCLDRPVAPAVPKTSNVYVDEIRQTAVDKIDLLFMIDNSISMADKQLILAQAVPLLVERLITPICVDDEGNPTGGNADATGACGGGNVAEFQPIKDIHVGVITSSLGSHGATGTTDVCVTADKDDHAKLLGSIRTGLTPYDANGFLKWDTTDSKYSPPGDSNGEAFTGKFRSMVTASGEQGCGYEASLESWYRFLIDPEPPASVVVDPVSQRAAPMGKDEVLLAQRAAFLRPDSLVAIVMLSDENDCSIQDEGYGYVIARSNGGNGERNMLRSTSACLMNPNDPCCQSCGEMEANPGCGAIDDDAECKKGKMITEVGADELNLRCWQQKRRFGFDLLYPTTRYSEGLRSQVVLERSTGELVQNPLYAPAEGKASRDPGLVFLAGIVGVPWQDIADEASLAGPGLRYLTSGEISAQGRWATILGDSAASPPVLPSDPLMVETPDDRTTLPIGQANPITMDALVSSDSTNPQANKINGHEQKNIGGSDLQYACTFKLPMPLECTPARNEAQQGCDCFDADLAYNRPLCQPEGGGPGTTTQNYAKAYPGLRHLQVLKEFGENSVVASICPKVLDRNDTANYGYNPAVGAIIDRLKEALKGKCLPRPLTVLDAPSGNLVAGQVPCAVVEAVLPTGGSCSCTAAGRTDARPELRSAVLKKLEDSFTCGVTGGTPCESFCTCEIQQLSGAELETCQNSESPPSTPGYCYVEPFHDPPIGAPSLVKDCTADSKRLLRFVGENTPATGAVSLVACLGASLAAQ